MEDIDAVKAEIKKLNAKEIFIYFNNDWEGYAIDNARELKRMLES